jgi:predicted DNA-binding WGR domain protein
MPKTVIKESDFGSVKIIESHKRFTLNFTDIISNSNKYYNLEILETDKGFVLYTAYGRVGGTSAKEYRVCSSQSDAEMEAEKIVKSKLKKGYVEVKLVQASVGSEVGKSKVEASVVSEDSAKKLGFKIEVQTWQAIEKTHAKIVNVSMERVRDEFYKTLKPLKTEFI